MPAREPATRAPAAREPAARAPAARRAPLLLARALVATLASLIALALAGCAISERSSAPSDANGDATGAASGDATGDATGTTAASNPAIAAPPSTTPRPGDQPLGVEVVVAFLDGCVRTASAAGPCHCAIERLEAGFTMDDLTVFEDRMTGNLEYPPQVAGALVDCREDVEPRRWSEPARSRYVEACTKGSDRLGDLCSCSVARAQDVLPERHIEAFIERSEVRPGFAELIRGCL